MFDWLQSLTPPTGVTGPVLITYVLMDVFLVVLLARILGGWMVKIKQPRVVGEILAGILLGPTLLGDTLSKVIAPAEARPVLTFLGTLALILFMFLAGVEFDLSKVKGRGKQSSLLAVLSIGIPALLGFPVAKLMHSQLYYGTAGEQFLPFALFIGAALSVTAFPVMAHILMERGQLNSPMGALGVATTLLMSILMFTYIAFAGAVAKGGFNELLVNIGWIILFGLLSWFVVRPLLEKILMPTFKNGAVNPNGMAFALCGMVLYGLIGHVIGIHAMVGGFVWGLIFPVSRAFRESVSVKVKDVAMCLFLPIFFALAGFQTDLKLLTAETLPMVLLMLAAAIGGKFLAATPAKTFGLSWRDTGVLAALFNTRGLLVLVAGLMGTQLKIISTLTFTIIVVVALVTNLMTLPMLNWLERPSPARIGGAVREKA